MSIFMDRDCGTFLFAGFPIPPSAGFKPPAGEVSLWKLDVRVETSLGTLLLASNRRRTPNVPPAGLGGVPDLRAGRRAGPAHRPELVRAAHLGGDPGAELP